MRVELFVAEATTHGDLEIFFAANLREQTRYGSRGKGSLAEGMPSGTIAWNSGSHPRQIMRPRAGCKRESGAATGLYGSADFLRGAGCFVLITIRARRLASALDMSRSGLVFACAFMQI